MFGRARLGWIAFAGFLACIPLATWMIGHVGTACRLTRPCLVQVAPGLGKLWAVLVAVPLVRLLRRVAPVPA
jgi:hypothetical protein